ncbi:MAG TPA: ankyrin repeat domain-containing protein, partial [Armatimonadota bacterium]
MLFRRCLVVTGILLCSVVASFAALIHDVCKQGKVSSIEQILKNNPIAIQYKDEEGNSPLHIAATSGNIELLKFLVRKGADVNDINFDGDTPLIALAGIGLPDAITILFEGKADLNK